MKNVAYIIMGLVSLLLLSCKKETFSKTNTVYEGYVDFTDFYGNHTYVQDFSYETNTYGKKERQYTTNYLMFESDTLDIVVCFLYNRLKNEIRNATIQIESSEENFSGENVLSIKGISENGEFFFGIFEYAHPKQATIVPITQIGSIYFRPKK